MYSTLSLYRLGLLNKLGVGRVGHIDRGTCGDAIMAASARISSPSDEWFGVADEQVHPECAATPG
jgi:hypothetical protein